MRGLNVGSGPDWHRSGWETTDHKARRSGTAWRIDAGGESFDLVFTSHMIEHIPHFKIGEVLGECNRVLRPGGGLRIVCPNLEALARAYVTRDQKLYDEFLQEDSTIRRDLGMGGMLMNFIVSPGADNLLFSRSGECIGGYAHVYAYDFDMLRLLLDQHGFVDVRRREFCDSQYEEFREPLHPVGAPPVWISVAEWGARERGITGFDRNPLTSLFVEARKEKYIGAPSSHFGTEGERGLDPANFNWASITKGYLHFSRAKAQSFFGRMVHRLPRRGYELMRAGASKLLPRPVKRVLKRFLGLNRRAP